MEYSKGSGVVTADGVVIVRNAGPDDKRRAGKSNKSRTVEYRDRLFSYHKHAASETSVVRDLQRPSTFWRVAVNKPGLSLSGKGRANINATTELSCASEPRAPRAASWTYPQINICSQEIV